MTSTTNPPALRRTHLHRTTAPPLMVRTGAVLVLVDYQQRLLPAIHDSARVLEQAALVAEIANLLGVPVIGTEQNPSKLGANAPAIRDRCGITLAKMHFDACADGLLESLGGPEGDGREIVIAGCEAHVCLLQTALSLLAAGYAVRVIAPACGSRTALNHALAMQRLRDAGATLVSVEMVAFEWLASCESPDFKPVLALLK